MREVLNGTTNPRLGITAWLDHTATGVIGQSLGGDATVAVSIKKELVNELKVKAGVALQPPSAFYGTTLGEDIGIPMFFSLGDDDWTIT